MFRNWFSITIVLSLVVGVVWALLRLVGTLPADGAQVAYPVLLAYYYGALPVSIFLLVVVFSVGFWWLPLAMVRRPGWIRQGALIGLSVLAFGLSVWSAAPLTRVIYRDIGEVALSNQIVRLGVRAAQPGAPENTYVVLACPGIVCRVTYVPDPTGFFEPLATIRKDGDTAVITMENKELLRVTP